MFSGFGWTISLGLLLTSTFSWSQIPASRQLQQHQQKLEQLQRSIDELKEQLQQHTQQEISLHQQLARLQRYRILLERSIALQTQELRRLEDSLRLVQYELNRLSARRDSLGHHQRLLLRQFYLHYHSGAEHNLPVPSQPYVRSLLFHYLHQYRHLQHRHDTVSQLRIRLQSLQHQRLQWLHKREKQRQELYQTLRHQERLLAKLRSRRQELHTLLRERQRSAQQLQSMIQRLITESRQYQTSPTSTKRVLPPLSSPKAQLPPAASTLPPKGELRWPSSSRRLLRGYGLQRNIETGIVWQNPGIDIAAPRGSPVHAVAAGIVKLVQWLPTYQNVVVVEHADALRSVYANLERVLVSPGTAIAAGTTIGSSGITLDGEGFHLQLWRGRSPLNPLEWLR